MSVREQMERLQDEQLVEAKRQERERLIGKVREWIPSLVAIPFYNLSMFLNELQKEANDV